MRFFDAVIRYETDLWAYAERALKGVGAVSLADLEGLRAIAEGGETSRVNEVSRELGITIGAASKLVDRLERAGLASRRANPTDGRSSYLALTPVGQSRRAEAEAVVKAALDRHVTGSGVDLEALTVGLERLRTSLAETAGVRA